MAPHGRLPPALLATAAGAALAAALGIGGARCYRAAPPGPDDAALSPYRAAVLARAPGLYAAVRAAAQLGRDDLTAALGARAAAVCAELAAPSAASARRIAAWSREMERALGAACDARAADDAAFRRQEAVRLDVLPELTRHLEALLHNHMLESRLG